MYFQLLSCCVVVVRFALRPSASSFLFSLPLPPVVPCSFWTFPALSLGFAAGSPPCPSLSVAHASASRSTPTVSAQLSETTFLPSLGPPHRLCLCLVAPALWPPPIRPSWPPVPAAASAPSLSLPFLWVSLLLYLVSGLFFFVVPLLPRVFFVPTSCRSSIVLSLLSYSCSSSLAVVPCWCGFLRTRLHV